ncbi:MAG: hypothetical protein H6Q07_422 [Acidobacteria bacterium]|nr:hypothetical protein [Acidobacteriota bacterium]
MRQLTVSAELAGGKLVRDFLHDTVRPLGATEDDISRLELALHEIFVNIAVHAYPEAKGEVTIEVWNEDRTVFVKVRDKGIPFNPAEVPPPDVQEKIRLGEKGGLGVYLFKALTDGYWYKRENEENVLTIHMKLE